MSNAFRHLPPLHFLPPRESFEPDPVGSRCPVCEEFIECSDLDNEWFFPWLHRPECDFLHHCRRAKRAQWKHKCKGNLAVLPLRKPYLTPTQRDRARWAGRVVMGVIA